MSVSFLIETISDKENFGGLVVLNLLAKQISDLGYQVYTTTPIMFDHNSNLTVIKDFNTQGIDFSKTITLYPEIIYDNPRHAIHVARWILFHTSENIEKTWKDTDVYFKYHDYFNTFRQGDFKKLFTIDLRLEHFFNKKNTERKGCCCLSRSKDIAYKENLVDKYGCIDLNGIPEKTGVNSMNDEFNKYEYFLTGDNVTYYSILSALSGCKSVIVKDNNITPEEFKKKLPIYKYGVAYGWDDLEYAENTRNMLRQNLIEIENEGKETIKEFIKFWEDKIDG